MPTHTPIVILHLAFLFAMLLVAALSGKRPFGAVCWWIGFGSAVFFFAGLTGLLVLLAFSSGFISPLAFAGGYALALIGYGIMGALFWACRPIAHINLWQSAVAGAGICVLTAAWFFTPHILSRSLVVSVATHEGVPIPIAKVSFKLERNGEEKILATNSDGQVVIPLPYMATIEGEVSAEGFGGQSIYIAPDRRTSGTGFTIIQKPETKLLGGLPSIGGMFVYCTPMTATPRMEVYLQKIGEGFPLPNAALADLAGQLREAQKIAETKGSAYPVVLSSGDVFNPEMRAQSPDAYRQMKAVIAAYDPKGPLRFYAADYWSYFSLANDEYTARLKKVAAMRDTDANKAANAIILGTLLGEDVRAMPVHEAVDTIQSRLEADRRLLKSVSQIIP